MNHIIRNIVEYLFTALIAGIVFLVVMILMSQLDPVLRGWMTYYLIVGLISFLMGALIGNYLGYVHFELLLEKTRDALYWERENHLAYKCLMVDVITEFKKEVDAIKGEEDGKRHNSNTESNIRSIGEKSKRDSD